MKGAILKMEWNREHEIVGAAAVPALGVFGPLPRFCFGPLGINE